MISKSTTGKIATTEDPDNASAKVFKVECVEEGEQYTYLNVKMQFIAGASYKVSYKLYPLKNMLGKEFSNTIIGGNFIYGTTENPSISNHTFANQSDRSSGDGWISVEETVKQILRRSRCRIPCKGYFDHADPISSERKMKNGCHGFSVTAVFAWAAFFVRTFFLS